MTRQEDIERRMVVCMDQLRVLVDEYRAEVSPTPEELTDAAKMVQEDGRECGLKDSVHDAYWDWLVLEIVLESRKCDVCGEQPAAPDEETGGEHVCIDCARHGRGGAA